MALTNTQRGIALNTVLQHYGDDQTLSHYITASSAQILNALIAAIGTNFDTQITTVLGVMVADAQASNTALTTQTATNNANITAWTIR